MVKVKPLKPNTNSKAKIKDSGSRFKSYVTLRVC